ncbi:MAG: hypothetical protein EXQ95_10515 [Alphaproteobacteria bacterium]|nr:hypothetical protein [Alphaproteobacteria bacterium]
MPVSALSDEAAARPEAQLLSGALLQSRSSGGKPSAFVQVPPSPLSASTLLALQQSAQQFAVRDQSIAAEAAEAPARELRRALASVTRDSTVATPDTTTTTLVETPAQTIARTVTETITVPGPESAGVQEFRGLLERAAARAGEAEDLGDGGSSDRRVARYADSVERRGDRLLDSLERAVDRGGERLERRVERAIDGRGDAFVRSIDRLFDRGGERGVSAFEEVLKENGARVIQTLGKVLEATGDNVSKKLEDLLVEAGPEVVAALQETVDRVRPTVTQEVTREETEVIPGSVEAVTTTIPGGTVTTSDTATVETPPTPAEARADVHRQVEAYANASSLIAPLQELASPPPPVPIPAALVERPEPREQRETRSGFARENDDRDRRSRQVRSDDRTRRSDENRVSPPAQLAGGTAPRAGALLNLAS